jgi:hypothetical protein
LIYDLISERSIVRYRLLPPPPPPPVDRDDPIDLDEEERFEDDGCIEVELEVRFDEE